jgi:hypothetical protein
VTRLSLPRLSSSAVALLANAATRSDDDLYAITGGNPFFVTEVLANPDGGVPATVRDAVLARASNLGSAALDVLELASIVPRAIETWLSNRCWRRRSKHWKNALPAVYCWPRRACCGSVTNWRASR